MEGQPASPVQYVGYSRVDYPDAMLGAEGHASTGDCGRGASNEWNIRVLLVFRQAMCWDNQRLYTLHLDDYWYGFPQAPGLPNAFLRLVNKRIHVSRVPVDRTEYGQQVSG